jgi:putative component of membrane protein insertase Oxa1/YidC/SpoIIIJ protein YidD
MVNMPCEGSHVIIGDRWPFLLVIVIGILWVPQGSNAEIQVKAELAFIVQSNPLQQDERQRLDPPFTWDETSEMTMIGTGLIRWYQLFISTQDSPVCYFYPSCSRFGMQSIQRYGFFRGVLLTADRLLRDNGMGLDQHYALDKATQKYYDPVEHYSPDALKR